jgi:4-amino-4-deoxy-L-arabinose transferase-like glycosyltransferase
VALMRRAVTSPSCTGLRHAQWVAWVTLILVTLLAIVVRVRLLDVPLDRDEGEYAYMGQLLLRGIPPYVAAYNMKMPGVYGVHAFILGCFGETPAAVHAGLLIATLLTAVLVFALCRSIQGTLAGIAAATLFTTLALNPRLHGLAGYAEHYVLPFAVAGALALIHAVRQGRLSGMAIAGLLFGLAAVVKQSGAAFLLFAIAYVALTSPEIQTATRRLSTVVSGATLPVVIVGITLAASGAFPQFWFWTVQYAGQYVTQPSLIDGVQNFARTGSELVPGSWPVVLLGACGLVVLLNGVRNPTTARAPDDTRHRIQFETPAMFLVLLLAASVLGMSAGLYFRHQYFLLLAPVLALLGGIASEALVTHALSARWHAAALAAAACLGIPAGFLCMYEARVFFAETPTEVSRDIYGLNPFAEAVEVSRYIRERSNPTDTIAVIGSEPQIYFYARRTAATGYIYMYPLMEIQAYAEQMQADMIREIEAARPAYLVFVNVPTSWLLRPEPARTIVAWLNEYWRQFDRVGVADIQVPRTEYRWDGEAREYAPKSPYSVMVFRRKPG